MAGERDVLTEALPLTAAEEARNRAYVMAARREHPFEGGMFDLAARLFATLDAARTLNPEVSMTPERDVLAEALREMDDAERTAVSEGHKLYIAKWRAWPLHEIAWALRQRLAARGYTLSRSEPEKVEYPKHYSHRRGCSRTHPVPFPCDNGTPVVATPPEPAREALDVERLARALAATFDDGDGEGWRLVLMSDDGGVVPTALPLAFVEAIAAYYAEPREPAP